MSAPTTCTVSGTIYGAGGSACAGALVRVRIIGTAPIAAGDGYAAGEPSVSYTDASGALSLVLPRLLTVWLEIPAVGLCHTFTVPDAATATLGTLTLTEYNP